MGSPYGATYDTTAVAADNAAALGVIVVASAGNSRDRSYVVGAPSIATRVVSVAASQQSFLDEPQRRPTPPFPWPASRRADPRRGDALLKPDLAAPGANIVSAASRSGSLGITLSGTSMAAPHVAGAMTLLRQLHPDWSVEELKALAMNSALPLLYPGNMVTPTLYSPAAVGAGEIDLHAASRTASLLVNATLPGAVSLSFGTPPVANRLTMTSQVRLINRGAMTQTYRLGYASVTDMSGVDIVVPTAPVTVPAGSAHDRHHSPGSRRSADGQGDAIRPCRGQPLSPARCSVRRPATCSPGLPGTGAWLPST